MQVEVFAIKNLCTIRWGPMLRFDGGPLRALPARRWSAVAGSSRQPLS